MIGPHHSIIRRFTSGAHGAAACTIDFNDDTSCAARSSSLNFSKRTNIVGTNWAWVTRCSAMSSRHRTASKRSMKTTVPPKRCTVIDQTKGAE